MSNPKPPEVPLPLLRISEVGRRLALSVPLVKRLIAEGRLEAVTLAPNCVRVPEASVTKFIHRAMSVGTAGVQAMVIGSSENSGAP